MYGDSYRGIRGLILFPGVDLLGFKELVIVAMHMVTDLYEPCSPEPRLHIWHPFKQQEKTLINPPSMSQRLSHELTRAIKSGSKSSRCCLVYSDLLNKAFRNSESDSKSTALNLPYRYYKNCIHAALTNCYQSSSD